MAKRSLKLFLVSVDDEGNEEHHRVKTFKVPSFKKAEDEDKAFEEFIKDTSHDVKKAISDWEYEVSLPSPGIESGCW